MPAAVAVAAWVGVAAAGVGVGLGAAAGPPQAATTSASPASRLNEARYLVCIRHILPLGRRLIGERRRPILYLVRDRDLFGEREIRNHGRLSRGTSLLPRANGGDEIRHQHGQDEQRANDSGL